MRGPEFVLVGTDRLAYPAVASRDSQPPSQISVLEIGEGREFTARETRVRWPPGTVRGRLPDQG